MKKLKKLRRSTCAISSHSRVRTPGQQQVFFQSKTLPETQKPTLTLPNEIIELVLQWYVPRYSVVVECGVSATTYDELLDNREERVVSVADETRQECRDTSVVCRLKGVASVSALRLVSRGFCLSVNQRLVKAFDGQLTVEHGHTPQLLELAQRCQLSWLLSNVMCLKVHDCLQHIDVQLLTLLPSLQEIYFYDYVIDRTLCSIVKLISFMPRRLEDARWRHRVGSGSCLVQLAKQRKIDMNFLAEVRIFHVMQTMSEITEEESEGLEVVVEHDGNSLRVVSMLHLVEDQQFSVELPS